MGRNRNYHVNYLSAWLTPHLTKQANSRQDTMLHDSENLQKQAFLYLSILFSPHFTM